MEKSIKSAKDTLDNFEYKDRTYILIGDKSPISLTIANRHKEGSVLQYFDEEKKRLRSLRYATNHPSVFEDEQQGSDVVLGSITFEDGKLHVPKENVQLQHLLSIYHPKLNVVYKEFNPEKDAEEELRVMNLAFEAEKIVREMNFSELEAIARFVIDKPIRTMSQSEVLKEMVLFAKSNPIKLIDNINDDFIQLKGLGKKAVEFGILRYENYCFFKDNDLVLEVPMDISDEYLALARYLNSKEGAPVKKALMQLTK